ncbi:MAG: T9SS type A sorting domain-containing protein [Chitinophagaceae bacterium]|nr:T9SS type A sorting domain-containing protein [Chitinophagaceae bacterium]
MVQSYSLSGYATDAPITSLDLFNDGSIVASVFSYGDQTSAFGKTIYGQGSFIVKLLPDGEVQWYDKITSTLGIGVYRVKFDDYGNVLAGGNEAENTYGTYHAFISKLDKSTGNIIWKKDFKSKGIPYITAIQHNENGYYFGGYYGIEITIGDSTFLSPDKSGIFILQCDSSGNILWINKADGPGITRISDIAVAKTNDIYVTGSYSDGFKINDTIYTSKGHTDFFIYSLGGSGQFKWMKTGGSNIPAHNGDWFYNEFGSSISIDSKNQIHILGETIGSGNFGNLKFQVPEESGKNVFWLTLGEKDSSYTVFSSCTESVVVDSIFSISVYPNPFIQSVYIKNLKKENSYNITFSNSIGQVLSKRTVSNTSNSVFNLLHSAATGIYFLNITSKEFSKTFKLIKQ